jgi:mono/diheme cytochrome c family protein
VTGYEPIMPDLSRTLSPQQLWALVAFLESQGGTVDVTASDIPAASAASSAGSPAGGAGAARIAGGSNDPMAIIRAAGCTACHKIAGEGGAIGPELDHVGGRLSANLIRESILAPDAKIARGYEKFRGIMPKTFGDQLTAAQLESLVQFLASHK